MSNKKIENGNNLVDSFNKLPRKPKVPSGMVANEWHFDIRYVPLEPNPSHVLAIINPGSQFFHMERLPLKSASDDGGIAFFPESSKDAAPEIARALLHAFVTNLGLNEMMGNMAPAPYGPWKLTTEEHELATVVGNELKNLGVRTPELCNIGITKPAIIRSTQVNFGDFYKSLISSVGYEGPAAMSLVTPDPIVFSKFKVEPPRMPSLNVPPSMTYIQELSNARPRAADEPDAAFSAGTIEAIQRLEEALKQKPEAVVKRLADDGNADAALDYGLRLYIGLECKYDRAGAREYLVKAVLSPTATDAVRAAAHGLLIGWCVDASKHQIRSRYMLMASHHADQAALFCRRASPRGAHASACVLMFMRSVFERLAPTMPQLWLLYKNAMRAYDEREEQIKGGIGKMQQKRLQHPLRYRCAAVGCSIQADTGKMLRQCAGKCDTDKKPSYCSKECQKADWKNHKLFCVPGAECSVIDDGTLNEATAPAFPTAQGSIQVPVMYPDGSRTMISSSTLSPQMLRDISKNISELASASGSPTFSAPSHVEVTRSDMFTVVPKGGGKEVSKAGDIAGVTVDLDCVD